MANGNGSTTSGNGTTKAKKDAKKMAKLEAENAQLRKVLVVAKAATRNNGPLQKAIRDCGI